MSSASVTTAKDDIRMDQVTTHQPESPRRRNERTCVGCGHRDAPGHLVRVVLHGAGEIVADLCGVEPGRGAHVHPSAECMGKAAHRGLARSYRRTVSVSAQALTEAIVRAAEVRVAQLIAAASAGGQIVSEPSELLSAMSHDALSLVIIAGDAPRDRLDDEIRRAILRGGAVAWGSCASLGALAGCESLAVVGIRSRRLGDTIAQACRVADGARTGAEVR